MFSRIGAAAIKPDLTNTLALCNALGNPQDKIKTVHIAGTNGKGSTSHMLAAIFQQAGYKTGLYTSPHLVDFRERIRIDGVPVGEAFVNDFVAQHKDVIEEIEPSFFEITVAMAFEAFAVDKVDIAIIETGLGGRLDSTNVIHPELSIITNISLDHTDLLGKTIPEIAREKAGIIKQGVPVVIGEYDAESEQVFADTASTRNSKKHDAWKRWNVVLNGATNNGLYHYSARQHSGEKAVDVHTQLAGIYQQHNIGTVLTAVEVLAEQGWKLSVEGAVRAMGQVKERTGLRGRWDILRQHPFVVADVAHNVAGLTYVMESWRQVAAVKKHIIVGFVRDKDVRAALSLFPKDGIYHFCAANNPRALPAEELAEIGNELGLSGEVYSSITEAIAGANALLNGDDALLITGSFFVVGEALQVLGKM
jgi:dihydrofolate synthase/folylpolyglutamate synthase